MDGEATKPLNRWGKFGVGLFFASVVAFGGLVEQRSAFLTRRMGDLDVFLRAAWAVRNDADLYAITSDNDWHYLYPPLYAILMTPLADPPRTDDPSGYVPYAASVAICYLINIIAMFLAVHWLASALEEHAADSSFRTQPQFCKRWWLLRLWPILICCLPIGHTLSRGQVNLIVLAALCAAMAGWMRQQRFRAGLWLAFAICIKVIPIYLLVYPIWKRDGRTLMGCLAGCFVGLVLIPGLAFGPTRAVTHYQTYATVFFGPYFNLSDDDRSREEIATTDSIGVKNALHNWMYLGLEKYTERMHDGAKAAYFLLGFAMTLLTLRPGPRSNGKSAAYIPHQIASLVVLMVFFSPVSHAHYMLFCLPIVMCLLSHSWQFQRTIRIPRLLTTCFILFNGTMALAYLPGLEVLKDLCAALFAAMPLWVIPVLQMWRPSLGVASRKSSQDLRWAA